jgi:hypothetical protein
MGEVEFASVTLWCESKTMCHAAPLHVYEHEFGNGSMI